MGPPRKEEGKVSSINNKVVMGPPRIPIFLFVFFWIYLFLFIYSGNGEEAQFRSFRFLIFVI